MNFISIWTYLAANAAAVIVGVIYWWTVENMQPITQGTKKPEKLPLIVTLAILLTPLGALIVSMVIKSRRLISDIKQGND